MLIYVTAFAASFANIFLRAFQQKNVMKDKFLWVLPTSMSMAAAEYFSFSAVILSVVDSGNWVATILSIGLGGGLGCLASMTIHNRMHHKSLNKVSATTQENQA